MRRTVGWIAQDKHWYGIERPGNLDCIAIANPLSSSQDCPLLHTPNRESAGRLDLDFEEVYIYSSHAIITFIRVTKSVAMDLVSSGGYKSKMRSVRAPSREHTADV